MFTLAEYSRGVQQWNAVVTLLLQSMVYDSQKKVILSVRKRAMILGFQKEKKKAFYSLGCHTRWQEQDIQTLHVDDIKSTGLIHWKKLEANLPPKGCMYICK